MSLYQPTEESEIIDHSVSQLARKYAGKFDETDIRPIVTDSYNSFADAKVRSFVPVFTTRYADDRLRALAKVRGLITDTPPSVLFVCVHNAGRSQMAAGWLRTLSKGRIEVYSGGSLPGKDLNAAAVAAMQEVGIDIATEFPKPFAVEIVQAADVVITMGCGDTCPIFPGKRYEDWALDDPAGLDVAAVRPIRDAIKQRVEDLIRDMGVSTQ
ncbi:MAG: arsenate reductase ArsC [Actinobacteria bacterium]|jgi:protein-tyrosine-phosphatase|nr:arsenate reductase ArsC [Actinomycetota bacterium]NCV97473.1 arsenate reductase ArsC [Acidimicrobiia bacterium]NBS37149.1 arsenate reductase ArsC [Actinomycetota bacterium]NCV08952.1 arsenate reductase ArsC [Actinomycetota bacterium]NCW90689.1 arsenate reductase ArsC [Acidimicrobiia bacterium]